MNLLLQQLAKVTQGQEPLDILVLLGCGRLKELSSLNTSLAKRIVCIDASPRLEAVNRAHIATLPNANYVNTCVANTCGIVSFYCFNFAAYDGLQSLTELAERPRNLAQLETTTLYAIGLDQLIEQLGIAESNNNALLIDIGECGEQVLRAAKPEQLQMFVYIGLEHAEKVAPNFEDKYIEPLAHAGKLLSKGAHTIYQRKELKRSVRVKEKTLQQQLQEDLLALEWLKVKHTAEIESLELAILSTLKILNEK